MIYLRTKINNSLEMSRLEEELKRCRKMCEGGSSFRKFT